MIDGLVIKQMERYDDDRGVLFAGWRDDENSYRPMQFYASWTKPGVRRGGHYHHAQADFFCFIGPGNFDLHLWDVREDSPTKGEHMVMSVGEDNPVMVRVDPGLVHGYINKGDVPALSINIPNKLYKGENKSQEVDEIRYEEDPRYQMN